MESIRILQDTYEKLYALTEPLASFLEDKLPCISSNWRFECVDRVLKTETKNGKEIFIGNKLAELDIFYLIKILLDNENFSRLEELFPDEKVFHNKTLFEKVRSIRNAVFHPKIKVYSEADYKNWEKSIADCAEMLGHELKKLIAKLHEDEKRKLLEFIFSKVCDPALADNRVPEEIKIHIRGTKHRLEIQNTASGIMAFFTDALEAVSGKKIYDVLNALNLESFESIKPDIQKLYYNF